MKKPLNTLLILFTVLLLTSFTNAQTAEYVGLPEEDADFVPFIQKNLGRIVTLKLTLSEDAMITAGYKGVQPMFDGAEIKGISYSFFLEYEGDAYDDETGKYQCANTNWNKNLDQLTGKFKVSRIIKTKMRNYRAVFLVPVK